MSNALTLHDMSPGLRKVVGRESPRATLAEEPDAGNPLVRIWRGAELGNRSAYSTTAFSTARCRQQLAGHLRCQDGLCVCSRASIVLTTSPNSSYGHCKKRQ
jgi:hypothetical protein